MALRGYIVILKRDGTSGSSCEWRADKCIFGSESSCDVCIKLNSVDPFHCKLENSDDGRVFIINVAKSPRTLLNGSGVFERTFVAHNSLITIGDRNFKFKYPENSQWRLYSARSSLSKPAQSPLVLSSSRLVADVSQLPAVKSGSPRRPHLQTPRPRTPTLSSQRSGLSTRDRYGPTPTRPAALSPDVSVKRRPILKKRSPSLEALASPVQKRAKVFVLSETPFLTGTQYIKRLRRSSSLDASIHSNNSASFYSANTSNQSRTYFAKSSPSYVQKKGVQFGPRLSPEQFDSRLPPATPLKRGDLPPSDLNTRSRHSVVKKTPGFVPSPVLVLKSPVVKGTPVLNTPKSLRSPNLLRTLKCGSSSEVATPELSVRKILKTPVSAPSPGLSVVRELVKSPKSSSPTRPSTRTPSPKQSGLRDLVKTPKLQPSPKLSGIQVLLKTPKQFPYPRPSATRRTVSTPKSLPTPRLSGVRQLVKTPKCKPSPELVGVRDLLKTPKALPPPRLSAVRTSVEASGTQPSPGLAGVRDMLKTPGSQPSPRLSGVRKLMKTPKSQKSPRLVGVRELFKTPKLLPSPRLSGVRKLMKTPKSQRSPRLTGLREMLKTPKSLPSPRLSGVKRLLKTPQSFYSPSLAGMQELVRTPKIQSSPRLSGVRELMSTPKSLSSLGLSGIGKSIQIPKSTGTRKSPRTSKLQQSPRLAGIREMVRTPKSIPSPRLSGIKEIMVDLTGERTRITTFPKPATPKKRPARRGGTRITRNKTVEGSTANVTPIRTTRGRRNASRPVVKSTSKKNTVKKVGNQMVTVAAGKSHATVRPRGRGRNPFSVPEVAIDLEEKGHVEPVSSKVKTGRSQRRVVKKATEIVAFAEPEVRSTRRKRNLSPSPPSISFDLEGAAAPSKRARATRGRAEAKKLTEAKVAGSVTVEVRSTRKRRISYSPDEITIDLEGGENAEPTSPKRIRTIRGKAAEKKTVTQTTQTATRRINKAKIALPAKKPEVSTLVRKSGSRKRTTRAAKGTVEKGKEAEVVAPSTLVGKTVSKKRTTTKASTIRKSVEKASPVAAKFGRATRKVHFRKSVSEITRREELMSLRTPVRRTRGKATATEENSATSKSSVAKSPKVTSITRPVPRTRSKK